MARRARSSIKINPVSDDSPPDARNNHATDASEEDIEAKDLDQTDADDHDGDVSSDSFGPVSIDLAAQITAAVSNVYVTNARDGVNLRSGPGTEFSIIRSLPFATSVHLIKREGRWGLIDQQGDGATDGFVHLSFLNESVYADVKLAATLPADQVRTFWAQRNPRNARLYDRNGNALIDPRLLHASAAAIGQLEAHSPNYRVEMYGPNGGFRDSGSTRNHTAQPATGRGAAMDFVLIDLSTGRMLTNHPGAQHQHQGTVGQNAPLYQDYFNEVVRQGSRLYPRFAELARFGGYFASGANAMHTMHIDMRALEIGMGGGSLRGGFTRAQMTRWSIRENRPYT
ncbi:SH3 domain-containing protein [Neorhizobium galegae]|uniref:SH3 domain-containing protein n=1 Tax=Neorhizobium galegae TaxID=399 RepID=UPI002101BD78|nr:SH3 domain-containing protein [Neorhizobium galegae]MCQ1569151.1 SH3 domain-containing protein [Neorhizobium galegae]